MKTITIKISEAAYNMLPRLQDALEKKTGLIGVTQIAAASKAIEEMTRKIENELAEAEGQQS